MKTLLSIVGILFAVVFLTSCSSAPKIAFLADESRRATLLWQVNQSKTRFEAVFARSRAGGAAIDLFKGTATPVLSLRLEPDAQASVEGPAVKRAWSGHRASAPPEIALLLSLAALYAGEESLPAGERQVLSQNIEILFFKNRTGIVSAAARSTDVPAVIRVEFERR